MCEQSNTPFKVTICMGNPKQIILCCDLTIHDLCCWLVPEDMKLTDIPDDKMGAFNTFVTYAR